MSRGKISIVTKRHLQLIDQTRTFGYDKEGLYFVLHPSLWQHNQSFICPYNIVFFIITITQDWGDIRVEDVCKTPCNANVAGRISQMAF